MPETMREELSRLLQEDDPNRPLDSLESVVVLTYLRDRMPDHVAEMEQLGKSSVDRPSNLEGWVTWATERSIAS